MCVAGLVCLLRACSPAPGSVRVSGYIVLAPGSSAAILGCFDLEQLCSLVIRVNMPRATIEERQMRPVFGPVLGVCWGSESGPLECPVCVYEMGEARNSFTLGSSEVTQAGRQHW